MGLDPGIDHMSAKAMLDGVAESGGNVTSFISHCGGLVAPESDDNPWHYKISWNPRNVVLAGKAGAVYKWNGAEKRLEYPELFAEKRFTAIIGQDPLCWYPNRDSLPYIPIYGLNGISTFIRTTLRYPDFIRGWASVVQAGLTDDKTPVTQRNIAEWATPVLSLADGITRPQLEYLGLFSQDPVPASARTSADVLQHLLETRLAMHPGDKDMIVMLHEIGYTDEKGHRGFTTSSLVVHGEDHLLTAMAKTVGLPLGIAAVLILDGKIALTGLHIPILPEIYTPVMQELERHDIIFVETEEG